MKITVCELPHEGDALESAWTRLAAHARAASSELVLLPELPFSRPVWIAKEFDPRVWRQAEEDHARWEVRLSELGTPWVLATRPLRRAGTRRNEAFLWSAASGAAPLRSKHYLPDEPGSWEARWFARGDAEFPSYRAGALSFGVSVCTELWALDTFARYRAERVAALFAPRATAAATTEKWLALGTVAAVAAGAYCLSSNRVHADGSCGGVGWAIDPDGALLGRTSPAEPAITVQIDPARVQAAVETYPRYVFAKRRPDAT